jgi:hypothetical protein
LAYRGFDPRHEIRRVPFRRRRVGVRGELVEIADPAGADPAVLINEGHDGDVVAGTAGRQLQIHALIVDGERLDIERDADPGGRLKLGKIIL